jgi:hypothetical protein
MWKFLSASLDSEIGKHFSPAENINTTAEQCSASNNAVQYLMAVKILPLLN